MPEVESLDTLDGCANYFSALTPRVIAPEGFWRKPSKAKQSPEGHNGAITPALAFSFDFFIKGKGTGTACGAGNTYFSSSPHQSRLFKS
jgi:hypothetical protein